MFIKQIKNTFYLCCVLGALCSCTGTIPMQVGDATDLDSPSDSMGGPKTIAVLLPESEMGESVKTSIQMALLQRRADDINIRFMDLSGSRETKEMQIDAALSARPDLIIGPIFAEDVDLLRSSKPSDTAVLSFTSDASALGNGIMTMSLIPTQSVEAIVRQIANEERKEIMILAPDNASGYIMGNAALDSARVYGLRTAGFYYYTPGDMDSMKRAAENATMFNARGDANTRAQEILADILLKHNVSGADRNLVASQLEDRNKADTIGDVPFDAVLFLGNAPDSKALGSFMRYFDAPARKVKFFGTAMWDNDVMFRDMTMSGASFATLPAISPEFANAYRSVADKEPERISSMGYDAAMLAVRALHAQRSASEFLVDPSGFRGLDGLIRLQPDGMSQRALQIMTLDGSGTSKISEMAANNFINPLYQTSGQNSTRHSEIKISTGINPMDYLRIPDEFRGKYKSNTYYQNQDTFEQPETKSEEIIVLPEDSSEPVLADPDFQPMELDSVSRTLVDEVKVR